MAPFSDIQLREIFHFLFLEELLRMTDPKMYVLKGGVNLRFFFKSPRYSEDMDLDVLHGNVGTLKKNGYKILASAAFKRTLSTYGISNIEVNDPLKAKHTETTQRFRLRLITEAGESLPTKVEFSRRNSKNNPFVIEKIDSKIAREYQRLAFQCQHYTGDSAVVQKVEALAGRDITQARDLFDLGILLSGGYGKSEIFKTFLDKAIIKKARENLNSIQYNQYEGQVIEFLDDSQRKLYKSANAFKELKESVEKELFNET